MDLDPHRQLVILAAGTGHRFGGLKQLTPVRAAGEAIMDFTVFDAVRSGFGEVILVIRRQTENAVREHVEKGFGKHLPVKFVHQELGQVKVSDGRVKPWGTGQAVLAAGDEIRGPFAVANADDFYGRSAISALGEFLSQPKTTPPIWAMMGYSVSDTLPAEGTVSRGLVHTEGGFLESIEEALTVRRHPGGAVYDSLEGPRVIPASTFVSMNLWGFGPEIMGELESRFGKFLAGDPGPNEECFLPTWVGEAVNNGVARVAVLPATSRWCGLTSAADLSLVKAVLSDLVGQGVYPARLWT